MLAHNTKTDASARAAFRSEGEVVSARIGILLERGPFSFQDML